MNGPNKGGNLYSLTDNSWHEDDVTWNTAPLADSEFIGIIGPVNEFNWYEIDGTSFILGDGTYNFRMNLTDSNGADCVSKEGDPALAPRLIISVGQYTG